MLMQPACKSPVFKTNITTLFVIAFISLRHIFHELHEFAHMVAGRIFCGVWGTRDFNNVHPISEGCEVSNYMSVISGLAGPMVNYLAIWIGVLLIRKAKTEEQVSWGLALIFCSLPVARLMTALFGGGDEIGVARLYISNPLLSRLVVIGLILLILAYPLYLAFKTISKQPKGAWYFIGFLFIPMFVEGLVVLLFFNYLLKLGVLTEPSLFGAPLLVILVLVAALITFIAVRKNLNMLPRVLTTA